MGVTGLLDLLLKDDSDRREAAAFKTCSFLQEVAGVTAGVDLSFLCHHNSFVKEFGALVLAGRYDDAADFTVHWANAVTASGATLVFVADNRDAPYPPKARVDAQRRESRTAALEEYKRITALGVLGISQSQEAEKLVRKAYSITPEFQAAVVAALRRAHHVVLIAAHEGDAMLAKLYRDFEVDVVVGCDADYLVHGVNRLVFNLTSLHAAALSTADAALARRFLMDTSCELISLRRAAPWPAGVPAPTSTKPRLAGLLAACSEADARTLLIVAALAAGCDYFKLDGYGPAAARDAVIALHGVFRGPAADAGPAAAPLSRATVVPFLAQWMVGHKQPTVGGVALSQAQLEAELTRAWCAWTSPPVLQLRTRSWVVEDQPPPAIASVFGADKLPQLNSALEASVIATLPPSPAAMPGAIILPRRGPGFYDGPCRDGVPGARHADIMFRLDTATVKQLQEWLRHTSVSDEAVSTSGVSRDDLVRLVRVMVQSEREAIPRRRAMTIGGAAVLRVRAGPAPSAAMRDALLRAFLLQESHICDDEVGVRFGPCVCAGSAGAAAAGAGAAAAGAGGPTAAQLRAVEKGLPPRARDAAKTIREFPYAPGANQAPWRRADDADADADAGDDDVDVEAALAAEADADADEEFERAVAAAGLASLAGRPPAGSA